MDVKTQVALKMAIEALYSCDCAEGMSGKYQFYDEKLIDPAINAIKEALEQPAQEPVALSTSNNPFNSERHGLEVLRNTHPHQWQGLTDDVVASIWMHEAVPMNGQDFKRVYHAIEQALKEKNHGY